jgi:hypothetical protein
MEAANARTPGPGAVARSPARSTAQWFCLIGGAILLVRGAVGVALDPEFASPGEGWHQLIHLTTGVVLLAAGRDVTLALAAALGFGVAYAVVAVAGFVDGSDVVAVIPVERGDNVLHTVITVTALVAGLISLRRSSAPLGSS